MPQIISRAAAMDADTMSVANAHTARVKIAMVYQTPPPLRIRKVDASVRNMDAMRVVAGISTPLIFLSHPSRSGTITAI